MRFSWTLIPLCWFIVSCAPSGQNTRLEMESWLQKDSSELLAVWGKPDEIESLADGGMRLIWIEESTFTTPITTRNSETGAVPQVIVTGGQVVTMECEKTFHVGPDGKIVSADAHGSLCH